MKTLCYGISSVAESFYKRKGEEQLLISIAVFLIGAFTAGGVSVELLLDFPSLLMVLGITGISLTLSGSFRSFWKGFGSAFSGKQISSEEADREISALGTGRRANLGGAALVTVANLVAAFNALDATLLSGYFIGMAMLPLLYAVLFNIILNIISGRMQMKKIS